LTGTTLSKAFSRSFGSSEAGPRAPSRQSVCGVQRRSVWVWVLSWASAMTRKYRKELAFIRSEVGQNTIVHGFLLGRAVCLFSWQSTRGFAGPQGDGRFRWHAFALKRPNAHNIPAACGVKFAGFAAHSRRAGGNGGWAKRAMTAPRHPFPHHAAGKFLLFSSY
jgi:hypothetical protein